ncbi:PREDICTED: receptor-type tyrosine-protein phosphatase epsilon-like isoform X2 [Nicrophorus vespilloides]|uniref:Receptor-type tyrosine-protein phosphatase epsilon-like isoform X2 n=1 Tax=Nicrophorus vespilloides TaxID=110193 RepID=A0ABM1MUF0_NICVS|nr:PREDICTED: receptor-type tyrosine-protein phosphatase epsilon-like isoform X2 [Nicrophorus vespilloides]
MNMGKFKFFLLLLLILLQSCTIAAEKLNIDSFSTFFDEIVVDIENTSTCKGPYKIHVNGTSVNCENLKCKHNFKISNRTELEVKVFGVSQCESDTFYVRTPAMTTVTSETMMNEVKLKLKVSEDVVDHYYVRYVTDNRIFGNDTINNTMDNIVLKNFSNPTNPIQIQLNKGNNVMFVSEPFNIYLDGIELEAATYFNDIIILWTLQDYCKANQYIITYNSTNDKSSKVLKTNKLAYVEGFKYNDKIILQVTSKDGLCKSNVFSLSTPELINIYTTNVTYNSFTLEWDKDKVAKNYRILYTNAKRIMEENITGNSFVIDNLKENSNFIIMVELLDGKKVKYLSSTIRQKTLISGNVTAVKYYTNGTIMGRVSTRSKISSFTVFAGKLANHSFKGNEFQFNTNFTLDLKSVTVLGYNNRKVVFSATGIMMVYPPVGKLTEVRCQRGDVFSIFVKKVDFMTTDSNNTIVVEALNGTILYDTNIRSFQDIQINLTTETDFNIYLKSKYKNKEVLGEKIKSMVNNCMQNRILISNPDDDTSSVWIILVVCFAVTIIIILVILLLYFKLFRKKSLSEVYQMLPLIRIASNQLSAASLNMFIKDKNVVDMLETEFKSIPYNENAKTIGRNFEKKNRYRNILPNYSTHVHLDLLPDDVDSWYINANFLQNSKNENSYIATQCPVADSVSDFWRMVWQNEVSVVVMLTNLVENGNTKGTQYWPELDTAMNLTAGLAVSLEEVQVHLDYTVRTCKLRNAEGFSKLVRQFHFTAWPDHEIPVRPSSFVEFVRVVANYKNTSYPVVVHCSAGINRTGVYILVDRLWEQIKWNMLIDVPMTLAQLRKERKRLLSELLQYKFVYCALNELVNGESTNLHMDQLMTRIPEEELRYVNDNNYWLGVMGCAVQPGYELNKAKHRNQNKPFRSRTGVLYLDRLHSDDQSYYIAAVKISGRRAKSMICTQQPLSNTVFDFWRLIYLHKTEIIFVLHTIDVLENVFWPQDGNPFVLDNVLSVHLLEFSEEPLIQVYNLEVRGKDGNISVTLLHFEAWPSNNFPNYENFLQCFDIYRSSEIDRNVVLVCSDGAKGCGLLLTFQDVHDQLTNEQMCNVSTTIRSLRYYRDDFMDDLAQYEFLFNVIKYNLSEYSSSVDVPAIH